MQRIIERAVVRLTGYRMQWRAAFMNGLIELAGFALSRSEFIDSVLQ